MTAKSIKSRWLTVVFIITFILPLTSHTLAQENSEEKNPKQKLTSSASKSRRITFTTEDGLIQVGTFYPAKDKKGPAVILIHMLGGSRKDWKIAAEHLQKNGYAVLTFDLRGFGESITTRDGKKLDWETFTEEDYQKMIKDVGSAVDFLTGQTGVDDKRIGIIGAALGANIGLNYAVMNGQNIKTIICVSANFNYQGIKTQDEVQAYGDRPAMFCCSKKDLPATHSTRILHKRALGQKHLKFYPAGSGHGTELFNASVGFMEDITQWLKDTL